MIISLQSLPSDTDGIYQVNGHPHRLPARALYLHPAAAAAFDSLESETGGLVYSDIFRSAEASLVALQTKRGVQPPAYSAHNYGIAFDVAVDETMEKLKISYAQLEVVLEKHGWFCHRRDKTRGFEDWHHNWLGPDPDKFLQYADLREPLSWSRPAEARIVELYGTEFTMSLRDVQSALMKLRLYKGEVDGILGPLTETALHAFQRAWQIPEGPLNARTMRTLAYVACERLINPGRVA